VALMHLLGDLIKKPAFMAALVATSLIGEPDAAFAASRSGGRVGGRAPAASVRRAAPAPVTRSTTNVYVAPTMGYGYSTGYGGYGYGGGSGLGLYMGLSFAEALLREQQRQAFLQQQLRQAEQLGQDKAAIAALQSQLAQQENRIEQMKAQGTNSAAPAPSAFPAGGPQDDAVAQLKAQLEAQQREINALKATK